MARIPGEADFSGIPSARSGRPIAREDTSALFEGAAALGAGLRQAGTALTSIAAQKADRDQKVQAFDTEARFQQFDNQERQNYLEAQRTVPAGGAGNFAAEWEAGYTERARAFMETVPADLRPGYDARLVELSGVLGGAATEFGINEQIRFTGQQLDDTLDNTILPRITEAAALPDAPAQQAALDQIIADGEALINANPFLSPIEKDAAIEAWRTRAQTAFVNGVPPEDRGDWLGVAPSPTRAEDYLGGLAPNLDVDGLNPDFSVRLAQAAMDYEQETGQQARFTSFARTTEQQAQLYADYLLAHGMGESFVFNGVTYRGNPDNPVGLAAPPGQSRHEGGAAADIADGAFLEWMHANAARYGLGFLSGDAFSADPGHVQLADGAGPLPAMAPRLDAIPYENRNAMAADAATQATANANARAAQLAALNADLVNQALMGARNGSFTYGNLQELVNDGVLTDYDDVHKIETAIEEYQGDVRGLAEAQAALNTEGFQWLPGDSHHQEMVNRLWDANPALQASLVTPGAQPEQQQAAQASLAALVNRTHMLPEGAVNAIVAGLESNDPARMAASVQLIDALGKVDHFAVGRALTETQGTAAATLATAVDIAGRTGNPEVFQRVAGELAMIQATPNYRPPNRDAEAQQTAVDEVLGESYRFLPSHRADVLAVAGHVFNSMARERGVANDLSTTDSIDLYKQALQMAAGAEYREGVQYGGTTDVHGVETLVPMGMRADGVEGAFEALTDAELEALGGAPVAETTTLKVDAEDVRRGVLIAVGDGIYRVAAEITPTGTPVFYANAVGDFWTLDMRQLLEIREKAATVAAATAPPQADEPPEAGPGGPPMPAEMFGPDGEVVRYADDEALRQLGITPPAERTGEPRPPTITPMRIGPSGVLMQFEPAPDLPPPPPTAAERRAQIEAADGLKRRIKERLGGS